MLKSDLDAPQFNLETMAGVFPGTRTQEFHRLRVRKIPNGADEWRLLQRFVEQDAVILHRIDPESGQLAGLPELVLASPDVAELHEQVMQAAEEVELEIQSCGACRWWQRTTWTAPDGLAVGECQWRAGDRVALEIAGQACFAVRCHYWSKRDANGADNEGNQASRSVTQPLPPMVKSAELDTDRLPRMQRWLRRFQSMMGSKVAAHRHGTSIMERSGVGAGTEPCLVCHGRIANLGALTVESPDGDKETLSVWRCRTCYSTYLNDWIDRWERLDNLETEESYFRIAPAEAHEILAIIAGIPGADHPGDAASGTNTARKCWNLFVSARP